VEQKTGEEELGMRARNQLNISAERRSDVNTTYDKELTIK
jgi:hypothetical protein